MAKILLSNIQKEAEELQWEVLSTEYKNLSTEMKFKCPQQHEVILTYEKWRRAHQCPICNLKEKENQSLNCVFPKSKNDYRILALDQATHVSGWAIFQNGSLIRHGIFEVEDKDETYRINEVKKWIWNMVQVWQIDFVQIEDIQYQTAKETHNPEVFGVTVFKTLAHLQGVIENLLFSNNIPYKVVSPSTWRAYNEIKGKTKTEKKKNAQLKVQKLYDILVPLDEAEAICIGRYALTQRQTKVEMLSWE